jgi:hypothetical protein
MRGKLIAAVVGVAAVLSAGGCAGRPPGVDGDLTNNWSDLPPATLPVPAAPACYPDPGLGKLPPAVDCGVSHSVETVKVGGFTGADAAKDLPPAVGGAAQQAAYADCARAARDYVGGDWRDGRLALDVVFPTAGQWDAEGRWYRCDLAELRHLDSDDRSARDGSLKGALAGAGPLALTCLNVTGTGGAIETMASVPCSDPHNGEYAGLAELTGDAYPATGSDREKAQLDGCRRVVAGYTGVPNDDKFRYRVGQIAYGFGKPAWDLGNRGVRCYLWMNGKTYTRSLKGAGPSGLPINFA